MAVTCLPIRDADGDFVNRVAGKTKKGLHRITWDMTYANARAVTGKKPSNGRTRSGLTAMPGKYTATLFKRVGAEIMQLASPVEFELQSIYQSALTGPSASEIESFSKDIIAVQKRSSITSTLLEQVTNTLKAVRTAIDRTPGDVAGLESQYAAIKDEIHAINAELSGLESRNRKGAKPANIYSRIGYAMSAMWSSYGPTQQHVDQLGYASEGLNTVSQRVKALHETNLPALQKAVVDADGPWTVGAPVAM